MADIQIAAHETANSSREYRADVCPEAPGTRRRPRPQYTMPARSCVDPTIQRGPGLTHRLISAADAKEWVDRFGGEVRKGSDILVQALEREGVSQVFAYPGGASMEIHQALTRSKTITNYLCRHEQVGGRHGGCMCCMGGGWCMGSAWNAPCTFFFHAELGFPHVFVCCVYRILLYTTWANGI